MIPNAVFHPLRRCCPAPARQTLVPVLLLLLLTIATPLHFQPVQDPKQYNQDTYFSQLSGMQLRFSNDLKGINDKFKSINLQLANTNVSAADKVILLQQNLADQRDSLFNIQKYLNVPFALRSCQCVNLTLEQKKLIEGQVADVQGSIAGLERAMSSDRNGKPYENPKCPNGKCAAVQAINREISQMKNYVKIMNDTITSECCKVVNYVYRDNLVATDSWVYGSTNEQQYRLMVFNQSVDANLTQCPQARPFANLTINQCIACPEETSFFDLGSRQCVPSCEKKSLILILSTHQCDYNRTCKDTEYFSDKTNKCEINLGTDSSCPKDRPVWNMKNLTCVKCPEDRPYFDRVVKACRYCTENEVWQQYNEECVDKTLILINCTKGSYFSQETKNCEPIPSNTTSGPNGGTRTGTGTPVRPPVNNNSSTTPGTSAPSSGTYSQCPPSTPFWSTSDLACYKCPESTPSYNSTSNKCEACPVNKTWSAASNRCLQNPLDCPQNQTYNSESEKCQVIVNCESNQVFNSATKKCDNYSSSGQIGMCPPKTPFWNAKTLYCEKCNETTPNWNATAKLCEVCPVNTAWDENKGLCKSTIKPCPIGQYYNLQASQCLPINCSADTPLYNYTSLKCQPCPDATKYNNLTFICESTTPQRTNTSVCPAQSPYWNPYKLFCDVCPPGQAKDSNNTCQPLSSHFTVAPTTHQGFTSERHFLSVENHQLEATLLPAHNLYLRRDTE